MTDITEAVEPDVDGMKFLGKPIKEMEPEELHAVITHLQDRIERLEDSHRETQDALIETIEEIRHL